MNELALCLIIFLLCLATALGFFDKPARTASSRAWMRMRRAAIRVRTATAATRHRIARLRRRAPQTRLARAQLHTVSDAVDVDWNWPNPNYPRPRGARLQKRDAA